MTKFWYVYRPGGKPPTRRHETLADAIVEANRLANVAQGEYLILEVVGSVRSTVSALNVEMVQAE